MNMSAQQFKRAGKASLNETFPSEAKPSPLCVAPIVWP